jgi:hypothetical protein
MPWMYGRGLARQGVQFVRKRMAGATVTISTARRRQPRIDVMEEANVEFERCGPQNT